MSYKIVFKDEVKHDINKFDKSQKILILKQIQKIKSSPELGKLLSNINGYNLVGCRKMYVASKQIRVIYRIIDEKIIVEVVAVGKREDMEVYKKASQRL